MQVSLSNGNGIVYSKSYGYADLSACQPATRQASYQIASVTKQFTAAAILQLQNAGKLSLDDAVITTLPEFAFDRRVTLRMLLNQTSGIPDYIHFASAASWVAGVSQATVLQAISLAPPLFVAGSAYDYSNSNYFVLGAVIERVSGVSYASFLNEHIFGPLGLVHTVFAPSSTAIHALPYSYTHPLIPRTKGLAAGIVPDASYAFSAWSLWSNAEDMNRWDTALFNGRLIPAALFALAVTPPAAVPVFQQAGVSSSYGMGWVRTTVSGRPFAWHNGKTYGYTAFNGLFLDNGWSISVATNVDIEEATPLASFSIQLIQAACTASPASCSE